MSGVDTANSVEAVTQVGLVVRVRLSTPRLSVGGPDVGFPIASNERRTYMRVLPWQLARLEMQAWFLSTVSQTGHHRWYSIRELAPASPPATAGVRATRAVAAPMKARNAVVWTY